MKEVGKQRTRFTSFGRWTRIIKKLANESWAHHRLIVGGKIFQGKKMFFKRRINLKRKIFNYSKDKVQE